MVNGPGTVIFTGRSVSERRNCRSRTCTACGRRIGPTTRGTGFGWPLRSSAVPGLSTSTPSSAVAKRYECVSRRISPSVTMSRPARSWSRIARRGASCWASSMDARSTRQSSRARTRGGKRSRSLSRSSSQEGWAYEPTRLVGMRVSAACGGIGRPLAAVEGVAVSERGGPPSSGRLPLEVRDLDAGVLELDLEAALDRRRERELDAAALLDVLHEVVAVDVDLVGRVGDDAQADLIALAERQRLDAALRLAVHDADGLDRRLRGRRRGAGRGRGAAGARGAGRGGRAAVVAARAQEHEREDQDDDGGGEDAEALGCGHGEPS